MLILSRWAGEGIWLIRQDGVKTLVRVLSASNGWIVLEVEGRQEALGSSGVVMVWEGDDTVYIRLVEAGFNRGRIAIDAHSRITILRDELCNADGVPIRRRNDEGTKAGASKF